MPKKAKPKAKKPIQKSRRSVVKKKAKPGVKAKPRAKAKTVRRSRDVINLDRLWEKFETSGSLGDYLVYDEAVKVARSKGTLPRSA